MTASYPNSRRNRDRTCEHAGMRRSLGSIVTVIAVPVLLLALTGTAPAVAKTAPKAAVQKKVKPGKRALVRVAGFPARSRVMLQLQPTANRDGNGFGVAIKRRYRLNRAGRARIRFRMPRRYFACSSFDDCSPKRWRRRSRMDVNVCTVDATIPVCARGVARIR